MRQLTPHLAFSSNNRTASRRERRSRRGGGLGPKQANKVIQGMSETRTDDGEGEGITGEGSESKARGAKEKEREKKAEIRKRLIERTEERGEGAGVKTKAITHHTVFVSFRLSEAGEGRRCEGAVSRQQRGPASPLTY